MRRSIQLYDMTGMLTEDADFTLRTEKSAPQFSDNNRHTRDAMKAMTGARDDAMTGNGGTRDGRDGRRQDMLAGLSVVAAIHVKTTGGALARRNISEATSVSELQGRLHAVFPATADGIGQYEGIGNPTAQPQQMASATVWASKRASVCTRIAAVDAEMAQCDSAEDR